MGHKLEKLDRMAWIGFVWLRMGTSDVFLLTW